MASVIGRERVDMKELAGYSDGPSLVSAELTRIGESPRVALTWDDGAETALPPIWLRDHCPCDVCRHASSHERLVKIIDTETGVPNVALDNSMLVLDWPDGHESRFDGVWLYQRRPGQHRFQSAVPEARIWRENFMPERIAHCDFIGANTGQRQWLEALTRDGLVLLDEGPTDLDEVIRIAESIGPL